MPPPALPFVPPSELVQPWNTLEKTKLGLKFVLDPNRSRDLSLQSNIQRVTDWAIDLWSIPLQSCVAECPEGTPPRLVSIFRSLQQRCEELNWRAHANKHTDVWMRRQVLLILVSRNACNDLEPPTFVKMMMAFCPDAAFSLYIQVHHRPGGV